MIKEVERLFEAITGPGWVVEDEARGELELYNPGRTRRLSYRWPNEKHGGGYAMLGMSFLNENGGWSKIFSMNNLITEKREEMMFVVWTRGNETRPRWFDEMVSYDQRYGRRIGDGASMSETPLPVRVAEDRKELLYDMSELSEKLDFEMTANLFVEQMIRGEMERPVLVPEGYFQYEEPEEIAPGTWAHAPNITAAAKLFVTATTPEEKRIAGAINRWIFEQEIG